MNVGRSAAVLCAVAVSVLQATLPPWVAEVQRGLRDELRRSIDSLAISSLEKPYYLEYTLRYRWSARAVASFGSLVDSSSTQSARLTVGVRVGSPERDNTNFFDAAAFFFGGGEEEEYRNRTVPSELRYAVVRRAAWLATDAAYKTAVEQYAKKMAVLRNRIQRDTTPDFLLLPPAELADTTAPIPSVDLKTVAARLCELSAIARAYPQLQTATVTFEHLPELIIYVNSEGRQFVKLQCYVGIEIVCTAQASDGMPLAQTYTAYGRSLDELPTWDSLARAMEKVAQLLTQQASAPAMSEPYSGPVLFCGQAAAELIAQVFAPNLVAQRSLVSERGVQEESRFAAFQNKIGARVMAEFLTLESNPRRSTIGATSAVGAYRIDDEGIEAEPLMLVRRGYLETLLSSRVPTRAVRRSNGRCRSGGAMWDVLLLRSEDSSHVASSDSLIARMKRILERRNLPYGYVITELLDQNLQYTTVYQQTGGDFPSSDGIAALNVERVWRDGRRERVRGVLVAATGYQLFRDVVAVGSQLYVHNLLAPAVISPYRTGGAQYVPATIATPDLLVEDLELRPLEDGFPKPPLLPSPLEGATAR